MAKLRPSLVLSALVLAAVAAGPVLARDGSTGDSTNTTNTEHHDAATSTNTTSHDSTAKPVVENHALAEQEAKEARTKQQIKDKLDENHKKLCAERAADVQKRAAAFTAQANRQLVLFDKIAKKVEDFATTNNHKPSNYDALVADIAAKRAAVVADLATLKTDAAAFKCDSDNPKAQLKTIMADAKATRSALKDYRVSVRSLITAVKALVGDSEKGSKQ